MRRAEGRFREEPGLKGALRPETLLALAREAGFSRAGFVDPDLLASRAGLWPRRTGDVLRASGLEEDWVLSPRSWAATSSILVCCLSCWRPGPADLTAPGNPHGLIAPFARANYYRKAAGMLRGIAGRLAAEFGISRRSTRVFVNSRIPEKSLLAASGLAGVGKNTLCIVPGLGSLFIIAGIVLPVPTDFFLRTPVAPAPDPCGRCDLCVRSCPVGALAASGILDPDRCLQSIATRTGRFSDAARDAWGTRLYGCQDCQSCCPHNRTLSEIAPSAEGELGPSIPLGPFLGLDEAGRRAYLRGTALGASWIPPVSLLRNALVAAGSHADPAVKPLVSRYAGSGDESVAAAARWALRRL